MQFLDSLALGFFRTFGITQPTPEQTRRASWFLLLLLVIALTAVTLVGAVIYRWMHA